MLFSKKITVFGLAALLFSSCAFANPETKTQSTQQVQSFSKAQAVSLGAAIALPLAYALCQSATTDAGKIAYFGMVALAGTYSFSKTLLR